MGCGGFVTVNIKINDVVKLQSRGENSKGEARGHKVRNAHASQFIIDEAAAEMSRLNTIHSFRSTLKTLLSL